VIVKTKQLMSQAPPGKDVSAHTNAMQQSAPQKTPALGLHSSFVQACNSRHPLLPFTGRLASAATQCTTQHMPHPQVLSLAQGVVHWRPPPSATAAAAALLASEADQAGSGVSSSSGGMRAVFGAGGVHSYGPALGLPSLVEALKQKLATRKGLAGVNALPLLCVCKLLPLQMYRAQAVARLRTHVFKALPLLVLCGFEAASNLQRRALCTFQEWTSGTATDVLLVSACCKH
jgi:hypothetical protein